MFNKAGLGNLMQQAQKMQEKMKQAQAELANITVAGGAAYVARKIDTAKPHDALGTIAGNDSVVVVCTSPEAAAELTARLTGILSPTEGL